MAEHAVFAPSGPPWTIAGHDDGTPIVTANAFYSTATTWYVVGGGVYVPAGAPFPAQVTLSLRTAAYETLVDLAAPPLASGVADAVEGWSDTRWAPFEVSPVTAMWICMEADGAYAFGTPPSTDPFQSVDGADLYLAEAGAQPRGAYRIGTDVTTPSGAHYATRILVTDDPDGGGTVWEISGLAPVVSAAAGAVTARRAVSGAAPALSAAAGAVTARRAVAGLAPVASAAVGAVGARRPIAGSAAVVSAAFGSVVLADVPDPLPTRGTLVARVPVRGLVPRAPLRTLEARC